MSNKAYFHSSISQFLSVSSEEIRGEITNSHTQSLEFEQTRAWIGQVNNLQDQLCDFESGYICFELLIPRMGKRADVVILYKGIVFVLEYKVGESKYNAADKRQALSYAMDLQHFHSASHNLLIIPILIATNAKLNSVVEIESNSGVSDPICINGKNLGAILSSCSILFGDMGEIDSTSWLNAPYKPTPTIIEAAKALYANHKVTDISRSDASAENLKKTSKKLQDIITKSRINQQKSICFVTGVPGAGKTLVGLNIATNHSNGDDDFAVYLSGNGPLVSVLQEALARDSKKRNKKVTIADARREVKASVQNIHHFRDEALKNAEAPVENVVVFDEAQRAWNLNQTKKFMINKRQQSHWDQSEPEFLINVMDRHSEWCVVIALIGGGQEINSGEAGLQGWLSALENGFKDWKIYLSEELSQAEYAGSDVNIDQLKDASTVTSLSSLHLSTSMRSFRAEKISHFVHYLVAGQPEQANQYAIEFNQKFPLLITRDLDKAKNWIRERCRGTERSGLIASSGAKRLKAEGVFVHQEIDPKNWFLNEPDDVRSSNYLEDAASEFVVQGLELDWCLVGWDADYRYYGGEFCYWRFKGTKWQNRKKEEDKRFLENVYRVLLTRARQGMIIFLPSGDKSDETRLPEFYDGTYEYLLSCGLKAL